MKKLKNSVLFVALVITINGCVIGQQPEANICKHFQNIDSLSNHIESEFIELVENGKNGMEYFKAFPCSFDVFSSVFGYNEFDDSIIIGPLYDESYKYIELFFKLDIDKKLFCSKVIRITSECHWAADAVTHFQSFLIHYIKTDSEVIFEFLSKATDEVISDFWKFYFFGPHPEKKEKYLIELQTLMTNSHPRLNLLLNSTYEGLLQESREKKH